MPGSNVLLAILPEIAPAETVDRLDSFHQNQTQPEFTMSLSFRFGICFVFIAVFLVGVTSITRAQEDGDNLRKLQFQAVELNQASWGHWGHRAGVYSTWTNHSNRLIPVYGFGISLASVKGKNSLYRDAKKIESLYGHLPEGTHNPNARYFDQSDIYRLNKKALASGKKNIILMVFDGMDWQTTQAAAIYRDKKVGYTKGRGKGLAFQDYQNGNPQFGFCVTSPHNGDTQTDVNAQVISVPGSENLGGYSFEFGGSFPWETPADPRYLLNQRTTLKHAFTDSASSATSLNAGIKTFNAAINIDPQGNRVTTLAHEMQKDGYAIGVVTNVPISHATPAAVYSHNVTRNDYQDLTRDLLGVHSISHREDPMPGVDVLIGCGWGEMKEDDRDKQGANFVPGNKYLADEDLKKINRDNGGKYVVVQRQPSTIGSETLRAAAEQAASESQRLFGFFGGPGGHLPYRTADGNYDPTRGVSTAERYSKEELSENPTLAQMTSAALTVLQKNPKGFYLMVEAGDVDWANHNNNIDDSIGAVFCGEEAFTAITQWVEANSSWDETCLIVTADHGHMFVLDDPRGLTGELKPLEETEFLSRREAYQKKKNEN